VVGVKTPLARFQQSDRLGDVIDPGEVPAGVGEPAQRQLEEPQHSKAPSGHPGISALLRERQAGFRVAAGQVG
jgi:hypothetical protein